MPTKKNIGVNIKIQDSTGSVLGEFLAEKGKTLSQMAEAHKIDIPIACGAGACFVCAVKIISGQQYLTKGLTTEPLVELEEGQILTCIAGVKTSCFDVSIENDKNEHREVILQKIL